MRNPEAYGNLFVWGAPFAGALFTALFLDIRAAVDVDISYELLFAFIVWFVSRLVIGYILALPFLLLARNLGLQAYMGYAIISMLAAIPYELYVSDPMNSWHPTAFEVEHGFYLVSFIISVVLASSTGILFSYGTSLKRRA